MIGRKQLDDEAGWKHRALAVPVLCLFLHAVAAGCAGETTKYPEVRGRDGSVTVGLSGIKAGSGRFHSYRSSSGSTVDFLVYRDGSRAPHAVLDACKTCYRWKKGYLLDRDGVVCLKCDLRFKVDTLAQGTGSCVPILIRSEPRGEDLVIPVSELEAGARYF